MGWIFRFIDLEILVSSANVVLKIDRFLRLVDWRNVDLNVIVMLLDDSTDGPWCTAKTIIVAIGSLSILFAFLYSFKLSLTNCLQYWFPGWRPRPLTWTSSFSFAIGSATLWYILRHKLLDAIENMTKASWRDWKKLEPCRILFSQKITCEPFPPPAVLYIF